MTTTTPTARTLLSTAIGCVRRSLEALDHVTLQPHQAARTTLVDSSIMDDVTARAALIVPDDPCAGRHPEQVVQLIGSLAEVVYSAHAVAREATYTARDLVGSQQLDQCWSASRPVNDLTRTAWSSALANAAGADTSDPDQGAIPVLEHASDASRTAHPAARRGETIVFALAIDTHLRNLATASIQLSNLSCGPLEQLVRDAVDHAEGQP